MISSSPPLERFPWISGLVDGTAAQRHPAWRELSGGEAPWRGCVRAVREAEVDTLLTALDRAEDLPAVPPLPGEEAWLWEARCRSLTRLLTAALLAALAVQGQPPERLAEWLRWAVGDEQRPEWRPAQRQSLSAAVEGVDAAWRLLTAQEESRELARTRDAALQLLDDDPSSPHRRVTLQTRAPLLLSQHETGAVAWLWAQRVTGGSGELLRAAASWFDPIFPDTEAAVTEAWELVQQGYANPLEQDVRWWISGWMTTGQVGKPGSEEATIPAISGRSLQGAAAALFHCLCSNRPFDASVAVAAELSADGTLTDVGGLVGAAPKLQAAQLLVPEFGEVTVLIAGGNRLHPLRAAEWATRGVAIRVVRNFGEVVQELSARTTTPLSRTPPLAPIAAQSAAPVSQRVHLAGVGGGPFTLTEEPAHSFLELIRAHGYLVTTDAPSGSDLPWARRLEAALDQADILLPLLTERSAGSEVLEYQLQLATDRWHLHHRPRIVPVDTLSGRGRTSFTSALLAPWAGLTWSPGVPVSAIAPELFQLLEGSEVPADPRSLAPPVGTLPLDSTTYIVRGCDEALTRALDRGDSIVRIRGARQTGKTSLLARGLQHARERGRTVLFTDFQSLSNACLADSDTLYRSIARRALRQVGLREEPEWDPLLGGAVCFRDLVLDELLNRSTTPVIWAFDEVDRIFGYPYAPEFFGLIRSWHNERATAPHLPWRRLTILLAYATEVQVFIPDRQSPFNVGTRVPLEDLTLSQVRELNERYRSPLLADEDLQQLLRLLGGHPYLTNRALHYLATSGSDLPSLEQGALTDNGPFGDHLRRMLLLLARDEALREGACEVLAGQRPSIEVAFRLAGAGLTRGDGMDTPTLRCELYARFLAQLSRARA